jgi:ABC-type antimicrobial peptide transport system permease subunit
MISAGNIKMALEAIRSAKWRSLLTCLGIVIGVVSVVTTVSLGEGVKQRIIAQINKAGSDLITVRPGRSISTANLFSFFGTGSLTEADIRTIESTVGVKEAAPFVYVNGFPRTNEREYKDALIIATNEKAPDMMNQKIAFGNFYAAGDAQRDVAVIGKRVAEQLFQENVPVGKLLTIRDQRFVVVGVFEEFDVSPLAPNADYNSAVFVPYEAGKQLSGGQAHIYQILARPHDPDATHRVANNINATLTSAHSGQTDFSVLKQEDTMALANEVLNMLTSFIAGIAGVSLVVGGIGILNIMIVSVTERTREIGVRKAVGATNNQIMGQFLTEAIVLSLTGGLIGILLSIVANFVLRISTNLTPVLTWPIMVIAVAVSVFVGIIFGIMPALKAARKHPIDALRYE